MAENNEPNGPANQDNLLAKAIKDFMIREQEELQQKELEQLQQQQERQQEQEQQFQETTNVVVQESETVELSQMQQLPLLTFFNKDLEIGLPEDKVLPSNLARIFDIQPNWLQLKRKNKTFSVHATEDKFIPALKTRGKYEVVSIRPERVKIVSHFRKSINDDEEESNNCTIILNDQQKTILGGSVKKNQIVSLFGIQRTDFQLIAEDGKVISHANKFKLNPGATYYVIHPNQNILKSSENQMKHAENELSLNRPMSYMAPYFISVLKILFILSHTEDTVTFTEEIIQETKNSSLLCTASLSTCAYQVAFGFNDIAKKIQNLTSKIAQKLYKKCYDISAQKYEVISQEDEDEDEEHHHLFFEDTNNLESPFKDIAKIVELHQKCIVELEDFLQLVTKQMIANKPAVESLQVSLQIKATQEKQKFERKKMARIDQQEFKDICTAIRKSDEQICPRSVDLYSVSSNRNQLNHAIELVDKVLQDEYNDNVFADIAELLNYCSQVAHCSLMHWMFALDLIKTLEVDEKELSAGRPIRDQEIKQFTAYELYRCLGIWNTVSLAVPLFTNLDEKSDGNIYGIWKDMKDKINTSQYALEICYNASVKDKRQQKDGGSHK